MSWSGGGCFEALRRLLFGTPAPVAHPINMKIMEMERMQEREEKARRKAQAQQARNQRMEHISRAFCGCLQPSRD